MFFTTDFISSNFYLSLGYDQHLRCQNQNDFYATETLESEFRNANNIIAELRIPAPR